VNRLAIGVDELLGATAPFGIREMLSVALPFRLSNRERLILLWLAKAANSFHVKRPESAAAACLSVWATNRLLPSTR
jgi:hypothetical protein